MLIFPKEMEEILDRARPWKDGYGFKEGTPQEIIDGYNYVCDWAAKEMEGVM